MFAVICVVGERWGGGGGGGGQACVHKIYQISKLVNGNLQIERA